MRTCLHFLVQTAFLLFTLSIHSTIYSAPLFEDTAAVPDWFHPGSSDSADRRLQVFHPERGKVIGVVDVTEEIQQQAEQWLNSVNGRSPEVTIDAKCGYVFKIPLLRETALNHRSFQGTISELFLFYCPNQPPKLLVFSSDNKPYLLTFTHDVDPFIRIMKTYQFMN